MNLEDRLRQHLRSTEADGLVPDPVPIVRAANRRTARNRVATVAAATVVGVGALLGASALTNEPSVVDLADAEEAAVAESPADDAGSDADADAAPAPSKEALEAAGEPDLAATSEASIMAGFNRPTLVGVDDGFAGLQIGASGVMALRSTDGVSFSESPTSGFPDGVVSFMSPIAHDDGVFAVLFIDDGPIPGATSVATSTDLLDWTVAPLPDDGEQDVFPQSIALDQSVVVVAGGSFPAFVDPALVAVELGLLDEEAFEQNCGVYWDGPTDPIEILDCATGDPLVTIEPGAPGHADMLAAAESPDQPNGAIAVWTGSIGGAFSLQTIDNDGFASPFVSSTADGFVLLDAGDGAPTLRTSADGVAWSGPEPLEGSAYQLIRLGESVFAVDLVEGVFSARSIDAGDRSLDVEIPLGDDYRFGWIAGSASGPAGAAVLATGVPDSGFPTDDDFPETVTVTVDGYTLVTGLESGPFVVTGPDGEIIHELFDGSSIIGDAQDMAGVARFEGPDDERLIILDPETGADLFTLTQEEFVAAMGLDLSLFEEGVDTLGVPQSATVLFTTGDGEWVELDGLPELTAESFVTVEAVGDDEVLVRIEQIAMPPEELMMLEEVDEPTPEQLAAIEAWQLEQQATSQLIRIPIA